MRIRASAYYWIGRAGLVVSILLLISSALLLLAGGDLTAVTILGIAAVLLGCFAVVMAYEWERRAMLEQGAQELQSLLGFRVTKTRDGSQVTFVDPEGRDTGTQPAAPWAFRLWEAARASQLNVRLLEVKLEKAGRAEGPTKSVEHHDDGTIEIKAQGGKL